MSSPVIPYGDLDYVGGGSIVLVVDAQLFVAEETRPRAWIPLTPEAVVHPDRDAFGLQHDGDGVQPVHLGVSDFIRRQDECTNARLIPDNPPIPNVVDELLEPVAVLLQTQLWVGCGFKGEFLEDGRPRICPATQDEIRK